MGADITQNLAELVKRAALDLGFDPESLTLGQVVQIATSLNLTFSDVVIAEATGPFDNESAVLDAIEASLAHNISAMKIGLNSESYILGTSAAELAKDGFANRIVGDTLINKAVVYTLAAQIGNHTVGLQPCAGTGDSCPYTGLYVAILEEFGRDQAVRAAAVMFKIGAIFREAKSTTGCNMEGYGAGSTATAAALADLLGGTAEDVERAMVLAISPTIAVPCTNRVMVSGLCATHICGAIMNGNLSAKLAVLTKIPVTVPVDVMMAMASDIHPISARTVVPVVNSYMLPYFKVRADVDRFIDPGTKTREADQSQGVTAKADKIMRRFSRSANPITQVFGQAVVGGSSQAVGSPTNAARIANAMTKGKISHVRIELYPELFARRAITVPGILMAAAYGASTDDVAAYGTVMNQILEDRISVEIIEINEPQAQRIAIEAADESASVDTLNRGGARLVLVDATPSALQATKAAQDLNITLVEI